MLVERAVATLRDGGCPRIWVVLGAESARVRGEAELGAVELVDNPAWKSGMGSSLRVGLTALAELPEADAQAVAVLLVDTPGIGPDAVARLLAAVEAAGTDTTGVLLTATYKGKRGHPVILGREHWAGVTTLATADVGARAYLIAHAGQVQGVPCEDIADDTDLDVPPDPGS